MGVEARDGRMFCNTADVHFGPQCATDDEAERLISHIWRTRGLDPRALLAFDEQEKALGEIRCGADKSMPNHPNVVCFCGSGEQKRMTYYHKGKQYSVCDACEYRTDGWNGWAEGPART